MKSTPFFLLICPLLVWALLLPACRINFNTTGAPRNPDVNTLAILNFPNEAQLVVPYLSQFFSQSLQDEFLQRSYLKLNEDAADIIISGAIVQYTVQPAAVSSDVAAAQNRLTIGVRVKYDNTVVPSDSWEQSFSSFIDFEANVNFAAAERQLIEDVINQLTQDIFNQSLSKW